VDIIQRNLLRLIRCGAFDTGEQVEPMSEWKWQQLLRLSQIHGVTPWVADGILKRADDFFLQLSPTLRQQFLDDTTERAEPHGRQQLTNPALNRRLATLREEAGPEDVTFDMLEDLVAISSAILAHGISLRQLIALGLRLRNPENGVMHDVLRQWIDSLGMTAMARLQGALLMELFDFGAEEIPFTDASTSRQTAGAVKDLFRLTQQKASDWYFTQGESIFVRSSNSGAMLWHMRQALKYMSYYPAEGITSIFHNFAHSLTHIEE